MKLGHRLLIAVFAGFLINSFLVFIWGDAGLKQMNEIKEHRDILVENIEKLEYIHDELGLERDALLYDELEIELRARALGYFRDNEVQILLPNPGDKAGSRALGTLIRGVSAPPGSRIAFRVIFLCIFITVFSGTFLWRKHGSYSRKR
jgi:hypothetical protein